MNEKVAAWTQDVSPFHEGEQAIQSRLGVRDKMETIGRRFIRQFMPEQHRQFYQQLPFLLLGSVDAKERPWASLVAGQPGFVTSPDEHTLTVHATPLTGDPLNTSLHVGADVGLLGIELQTRRRNRVNGTIKSMSNDEFAIAVTQSFGNCPQYIQKRQLVWLPERLNPSTEASSERSAILTQAIQELIATADTFFIATRYSSSQTNASHGVDVSHRGGRPGFVRIDGDRTLTFPDFTGNNFFNTLGNILADGHVGLLFIDFNHGHIASLTGHAEIIWDGDELHAFKGAERLVRVTVDEAVYLPEALPFRWAFEDYSPALEFTGTWD